MDRIATAKGANVGGAAAQDAAGTAGGVVAAHRDLLADPAIQFAMTPVPPPPKPPEWLMHLLHALGRALRPVGRMLARALRWIARVLPDWPYARILLWTVIGCIAAAILWMVVDRIRHGVWRLPRFRRRTVRSADEDGEDAVWQPEAVPLREWLAEADALAAAGRYAEAVHHLLFRSVADIGRRRPQAVRPALTSRELATAGAIPPTVRGLFARIARLVERSLFGGRPVDADDWRTARAAYADLVRPQTWRHD